MFRSFLGHLIIFMAPAKHEQVLVPHAPVHAALLDPPDAAAEDALAVDHPVHGSDRVADHHARGSGRAVGDQSHR